MLARALDRALRETNRSRPPGAVSLGTPLRAEAPVFEPMKPSAPTSVPAFQGAPAQPMHEIPSPPAPDLPMPCAEPDVPVQSSAAPAAPEEFLLEFGDYDVVDEPASELEGACGAAEAYAPAASDLPSPPPCDEPTENQPAFRVQGPAESLFAYSPSGNKGFTFDAPSVHSRRFAAGAVVFTKNIKAKPHLNFRHATVESFAADSGRYAIRIDGQPKAVLLKETSFELLEETGTQGRMIQQKFMHLRKDIDERGETSMPSAEVMKRICQQMESFIDEHYERPND